MKKRILCLSLAVLMLLTAVFSLASCMNNGGTTTQTCTNHTDANHDGKCDTNGCGAAVNFKHVDANHDGKCDTNTCNKTGLTVTHEDDDHDYECDVCGAVLDHTCEDDDDNGECDYCGETVQGEVGGTHTCVDVEDGGDGICDVCGEEMEVLGCEQCIDYYTDGFCDVCGEEMNCNCVDSDGDESCDFCLGYVKAPEVEISYPWNKTTLIFQYTENDNNNEIVSASHKYLAGNAGTDSDAIVEQVVSRNALACIKTKVEITYRYYPDTAEYNWGKSIPIIEQTNLSGVDVPDIYCNFVYDMVGASLKGCFANLLADNISPKRGDNYFEFLNENYDPLRNDKGYMYEYMESLTLAPGKKMYVLASDYFIDMVRAFFCVPVNVTILEDAGAGIVAQDPAGNVAYPGGDRNNDGEFTLEDFYEQVKAGEWTYDLLAKFSAAVYKPGEGNQGLCSLGDDVVGYAQSGGGLASSGLVYTTSVEIITKTPDGRGGYIYSYPQENLEFYAFCDATKKLFGESSGICYVSALSEYKDYGDTSHEAIRARFSQNYVLFGDIVLVGALEDTMYQEMKDKGGFGIVPVPLYRSGSDDTYLTQIHNLGCCGAISAVTDKFTECTAFLNYQSTHSEKVLNDYYEFKLQYDLSNGSTGTIEMLQYIRSNVRTSFDKAMEDALHVFNGSGIEISDGQDRWHGVLAKNKFQMDVRNIYASTYNLKQTLLEDMAAAFQNYPD